MTNKNKTNKAFTLLELLIVVAIIGLLIAIAIPAFQGILNRARDTTIKGSLDGISTAMIMHKMDHDDLTNFCASLFVAEVKSTIQETGIDAKYITCIETADFVIMSSVLHTGGGWVVDSTGHTGMKASRIGLVGEWKFEGNANDTSGFGNHGTLFPAISPPVFVDGALKFDGVNDYVNFITTGGTFNEISFSFWSYFDDPTLNTRSRNESIFGNWGAPPNHHFGSRWSVGMHWNVNNAWVKIPNTNLVYGWNHYALIYDTTTNQKLVYINGVLSSTEVTAGAFVLGDWRIGVATALNAFYRGLIDEVRIFNRALSAAEIKAQFEAGR